MSISTVALKIKKLQTYADWKLLLFLVLFLNVKLAIKIPAIALIYILQFDFKFGFKLKNSRLPLFYLLIMVIPFFGLVLNGNYSEPHYLIVFLTGLFFWLLCVLAVHQVKLCVERNDVAVVHKTLLIFFMLNALVSFANLATIIWKTGAINPFTYQGQNQAYFLNTGDYIKGLTFDTSTTNAFISAFGVIYFLTRKNAAMLLLCMATLLFTGSNFTNIILLLILFALFVFKSTRDQKSLIIACLMLLVVFMAKISPQNNKYVADYFENILNGHKINKPQPVFAAIPIRQKPDSLCTPEEKKEKFATLYLDSLSRSIVQKMPHKPLPVANKDVVILDGGRIIKPVADINSAPYQSSAATPADQQPLVSFISTHKTELPMSARVDEIPTRPGKITGMLQTVSFLKQHPAKIAAGDGMGNFSSKLAFRVSGLGIAGGFPLKYTYVSPGFERNHLDLYLDYFSRRAGFHSLTNSPFSVYDQLLAEYGLLGLLAFFACYIWFFAKRYRTLTYGLPILVFMLSGFFIDYWFEQLSVLVLFELMLFLNVKETALTPKVNYGS